MKDARATFRLDVPDLSLLTSSTACNYPSPLLKHRILRPFGPFCWPQTRSPPAPQPCIPERARQVCQILGAPPGLPPALLLLDCCRLRRTDTDVLGLADGRGEMTIQRRGPGQSPPMPPAEDEGDDFGSAAANSAAAKLRSMGAHYHHSCYQCGTLNILRMDQGIDHCWLALTASSGCCSDPSAYLIFQTASLFYSQ